MAGKTLPFAVLGLGLMAGCTDLDVDLRSIGNGFDTTDAVIAAAERPEADARGLISYPGYQVVVAQPGDTVFDVASRVGVPAGELAQFNGVQADARFQGGETLVLPSRVPETPGTVDVAALAGTAIDRAEGTTPTGLQPMTPSAGPEPIRHRVQPGETAFSIARSYSVSPTALADWNGLDSEFNVRNGQILLIPVAANATVSPTTETLPGEGSTTPVPPSAAAPLPLEDVGPVTEASVPESPDLGTSRTDTARLLMPASGSIVRPYQKGQNDGIGISASAGSPVRAADSGTVAAITRDTDQVPIVVLRHEDNLLTVYAGVDDVTVKKGDRVSRGETIAKIRSGGQPFLHFEVRDGFESVDPMPYLN